MLIKLIAIHIILLRYYIMKIITWNINSLRLRISVLGELVRCYNPDIIALQETKVPDNLFPMQQCIDLGYKYIAYSGEKSYNGVAILSKIQIDDLLIIKLYNNESRHVSVQISGVEIHNFYVPAGGDIPDPDVNSKFKHKLRYLDLINTWFLSNRSKHGKMVMVGDLNIAPFEHDVWSSRQLRNVVSHTDIERKTLMRNLNRLEWIDAPRLFTAEDQKLYSWWSYRNIDWKKSDRGRRLDHIWVSHPLKSNIVNSYILKEVRGWERPSDHVPVVLELSV